MAKGDSKGAADYFDNYRVAEGDLSQAPQARGGASTGMPLSSGPQGGTREICNWISAAAVASKPASFVEYVPVYASPIGCGFAYWEGF